MKFNDIALNITNILLPRKGIDMTKWAAVACDQFTSQPDYWDEAYKTAENAPSTLNLMLPEIYLEDEDVEDRIKVINGTMKEYLSDGTLEETEPCMILIKEIRRHPLCARVSWQPLTLKNTILQKAQTPLSAQQKALLRREYRPV